MIQTHRLIWMLHSSKRCVKVILFTNWHVHTSHNWKQWYNSAKKPCDATGAFHPETCHYLCPSPSPKHMELEVDWQFGNGNLFHLTLEMRLAGLSLAFLSTFGDALPSLPILPWSTHHDIVPVANIFLTSSRQLPVNNPTPTLRALFARQSLFDVLLQYTIERDTQMRFQSHQGTTCCGIEASVPMPCLSINATNSLSFLGQNVKQSRPTKGNSATPLSTPFFKGCWGSVHTGSWLHRKHKFWSIYTATLYNTTLQIVVNRVNNIWDLSKSYILSHRLSITTQLCYHNPSIR